MLSIPITPPHVSINRVQIVDLPGMRIDEQVKNRPAYHLLSSLAVARYAREHAGALNLPTRYAQDTPQTRLELPRFVDACLNSAAAETRAAAQSIGLRLGRNLGHILLALHRGDAVNRQARLDWNAQDWEQWSKIERVWLGGGLMSGQLGELTVQHARQFLAEAGYENRPAVALTPYRDAMAILGAGRYLPPDTRDALCLDLGQTSVKRACLSFEEGRLARIHRYPSLAVNWMIDNRPIAPDPRTGQQVLDFIVEAIAQSRTDCMAEGIEPGPDVMLSVAAYVKNGRLLGNGLYATLNTLADDARVLVAGALKARTAWAARAYFIHDGTAASALHAGEANTAVLVVGTAIGVGFPPADERGLWPVEVN